MTHGIVKLMVIGLDGATFDVIGPLMEMGKLPHLGHLMSRGAHGTLRSIVPPVTGPAWPVLATGKNPGKLGLFDFVNRRSLEDFKLFPVGSRDFAGHTFWDALSTAGYRVGVFNYPAVVPAYHVNGWMVSGLGASKLHQYTYPDDLKQELDRVTGGYEFTVSYGRPKYAANLPWLVEDMKDLLERRVLALEHLLRTRPVDLLAAVFTVSDVASHTLWRFWDNSDPGWDQHPHHEEMRQAFIAIWQSLDAAVGRILDHLAPDGHVLVVSDHGFGPSYGVFHVNHWLEQAGYLVRNNSRLGAGGNRIREWLLKKTAPLLNPLFRKLEGSKAHHALRASLLREIDLSRSKAFTLENSDSCGMIYINRQYARLHGIPEEAFVRDTRQQLTQELHALAQIEDLDIQLFTGEELYHGEKAKLAPDILLIVDNLRCSVSPRLEGPVYADRPHHPLKSGTHRMDGILIAAGPQISRGEIQVADLQDIAPTLLHLANVPTSLTAEMDGHMLTELLKPDSRSPLATNSNLQAASPTHQIEANEEEESIVLQRLADLGYL
ncbi:MAG: alkaline phosphatase family protein [Chloroflexota bacterium]|nr:alkaline phosphatase family protein [Chloroflexota bacterium]